MTTTEMDALEALPVEEVTLSRAREDEKQPATLRDQLREAVPGLAPTMIEGFADSLEATKQLRIHEPCPKCGCNHVRYVKAPDFMERARAIDLLATNAEGRAATASDVSQASAIVRRVGLTQS